MDGSPIIPVAPPTRAIGLWPQFWKCLRIMMLTICPMWRESAVGSMPTYAAVEPSISFSSVPGMMSWIMPLHLSSCTKFFISIISFYYFLSVVSPYFIVISSERSESRDLFATHKDKQKNPPNRSQADFFTFLYGITKRNRTRCHVGCLRRSPSRCRLRGPRGCLRFQLHTAVRTRSFR